MHALNLNLANSFKLNERGDLGYRVELRNASGVIVNQTEIASGCGVCMDDQCSTPLSSTFLGNNALVLCTYQC